jgi:2-amino-4-hydroxy-6-hydroxymethyldihydropteridine diphosphokinase
MKPAPVIVALGANLGDPPATLRAALAWLAGRAAGGFRASSLWHSTPVDCPPGSPRFTNAVALFTPRPEETPESLLAALQAYERARGRRERRVRNEPRPVDLDLIAFGAARRGTPALTLPHPRAHLRRFVLGPLAELDAALVLPGQAQGAAALLAALPPDPEFRRVED